jgi:colanic acid biosynthesis protein WcaH
MYLNKETFQTVIASTPLISIDLVVKNSQGQYLLGYRTNQPAKNFWFVPGGRILKNESMDDAFRRLCKNELDINKTRGAAKFLGPFEHFYQDYVFGDDVTTHYVVMGYEITVDIDIATLPNEQHNQYKWLTKNELLARDDVHLHSKWYVSDRLLN